MTMIIPVRCFSCGNIVGDKWEAYVRMCRARGLDAGGGGDEAERIGRGPGKGLLGPDGKTERGRVLDELGLTSLCCRSVMLTHVDLSLVV